MPGPLRTALTLAVGVALAACTAPLPAGPGPDGPPPDRPPVVRPAPDAGAAGLRIRPAPGDACGARSAGVLVGAAWPVPLDTEGRPFRALPPGAPATADHRPERLNLDLTPDGRRVRAVWCG